MDTEIIMAHYPGRKWTVRQREWPNGRQYFVVRIGPKYGPTVADRNGGESKYYDRSQAQDIANELNGKTPVDDPEVIEVIK